MEIKNINGTSENRCACGSWLRHWEKFSGQKTTYCQAQGCARKDLVGAHVQKANSTDNNWYIYPLCNTHNQYPGTLEVFDSYKLIPANRNATCEK